MIEFIPLGEVGRRFEGQRRVRLSDAGVDGLLRADGLVRYLQDVATDDWEDTDAGTNDTWVVRRTSMRVSASGRWPRLGERVTLTTWCGGLGAAWAERRTNILVDDHLLLEAVALWVPIDPAGRPRRIGPRFLDIYGTAAAGRRVPGRVAVTAPGPGAIRRPWPIRRADMDVVGHANNAALWTALTDVTDEPVRDASFTHHAGVDGDDAVELVSQANQLWLEVQGVVRVSGEFRVG